MANKKLTKADLKRIEDLNKKVKAQKEENAKERVKLKKMKKDIERDQKKLQNQWTELKNARKQGQISQEFKANVAQKEALKNSKKKPGPQIKKLQEELLQMKTKYNNEGKRARQFQQERDQLEAEKNVLQRKLKNLQARRSKGEDPRIKHLSRENKMLKKQMKLLMIELNKKRRWFQRCIKSFKSSRQKWIKTQEDTLKKKGVLVKYVFLDDVKQIKTYRDKKGDKKGGKRGRRKFKNRIKVKARDGGVVVLRDVEIMVLDEDDDGGSDSDAASPKGLSPRKSRVLLDETEKLMEQIQRELEEEQAALGGDDQKEADSDDEFNFDFDGAGDLDGDLTIKDLVTAASTGSDDGAAGDGGGDGSLRRLRSGSRQKIDEYGLPIPEEIGSSDSMALQAQLVHLRKELDDRTDDVERLKDIMSDAETFPDPEGEVERLLTRIAQRGDGLLDKMENELNAEDSDIDEMKKKNDRWTSWMGTLSVAMAKNSALFNELLVIFECYLKELRGRVGDLQTVNDSFYTDKGPKAKEREQEAAEREEEAVGREQKAADEEDGGGNDGDGGGGNDGAGDGVDGGSEAVDEWTALKKTVSSRHGEVEGQFEAMAAKQGDGDGDAEAVGDHRGNREQEALDANAKKVRAVRDSLVANNGDWRETIETVSADYESLSAVKKEMVESLNSSAVEMKALLDLVTKIPKRKILEPAAAEPAAVDLAAEPANAEPAAAEREQ